MAWMHTHTVHCTPRRWTLSLAAVIVCASIGCRQEIYYEGSESGDEPSEPVATTTDVTQPPESPSSPPLSPAERSDALSDIGLGDVGRATPPPADTGDRSGNMFADETTEPPSPEPTTPVASRPFVLPPDDEEAAGSNDSLFAENTPDEPPPAEQSDPTPAAEPSTTIDTLFGPSAASSTSSVPSPAASSAEPAAPTSPPTTHKPSTGRLAWLLGSKWSLAALAADRGAPQSEVDKWFNQAQALARALGLTLPPLPEQDRYAADAPSNHAALDYLFQHGQQVGRELLDRYGPDHAALLEMAVKSNMLLALYVPGSADADAVSAAIAGAGRRAGLPAELYQPLLTELGDGASKADVSRAVFRLHAAVDQYLATPGP